MCGRHCAVTTLHPFKSEKIKSNSYNILVVVEGFFPLAGSILTFFFFNLKFPLLLKHYLWAVFTSTLKSFDFGLVWKLSVLLAVYYSPAVLQVHVVFVFVFVCLLQIVNIGNCSFHSNAET